MTSPLQYSRFNSQCVQLLFAIVLYSGCNGPVVGAPIAASGGTSGGAATVDGTGGQTDGGSGGQADGGTDLNSCTSNSECITSHDDTPYICKSSQCIPLTDNTYCPLLIPSNAVDLLKSTEPAYSPIIIGGFANMGNPQLPYETTSVINWAMAMDEFNKSSALTGLPGFNGGNRRPLLGLMCYSNITDVGPSMKRLTEEVGVTSILSALSPANLLSAYNFTTTSGNPIYQGESVFFMNARYASIEIASTNTQNLMWGMLGDPNVVAADVVALLKQIEPFVNMQRAAAGDTPDSNTNPLRVTLVMSDYPTANELGQTLQSANLSHPESQLQFNDKLAIDQGTNSTGSFRTISEPTSVGVDAGVNVNVSGTVLEIQNHPPHVIVVMATNEFAAQVIDTVERTWTILGLTQIRPYYIMSPFLVGSVELLNAVAANNGSTPPLSRRIAGVNSASAQDETSKALYNSYQARLASFYHGKLVLSSTENYYDAAYYLIYSIAQASVSSNDPDGKAIATALMSRIISDSPTDPGYVYIDPYGTPSLGQTISRFSDPDYSISLWGTMGAPNFDKPTGMRISPTSAWCIDLQSGSSSAYEFKYDGLVYDPENMDFTPNSEGVPACLQNYCPLPDAAAGPCPLHY